MIVTIVVSVIAFISGLSIGWYIGALRSQDFDYFQAGYNEAMSRSKREVQELIDVGVIKIEPGVERNQ